MVDRITQSVKRISSGLRPEVLDELGLIEAIKWLAKEFQNRNKIRCITALPSENIPASKNFPITLYRIVQEALTNVARHAEAAEVTARSGQQHHCLLPATVTELLYRVNVNTLRQEPASRLSRSVARSAAGNGSAGRRSHRPGGR